MSFISKWASKFANVVDSSVQSKYGQNGQNAYQALAINYTDATSAQITSWATNWMWKNLANGFNNDDLKFYYKYEAGGTILNVLAKTVVMNAATMAKNEIVDAYKRMIQGKVGRKPSITFSPSMYSMGADIFDYEDEEDKREKELQKYGKFDVDPAHSVIATDFYGYRCVDALMLGVPSKTPIKFSQKYLNGSLKENGNYITNNFVSNWLVWYDVTAMITVNSEKNLVITKVQGRDYSRKELISNGDIKFSVSGTLSSDMADIYPESELQKFRQIMQYKGVVKVNNQVMAQYGIDKIVITDWSVDTKEEGMKSMINYSFNAVGVQPIKELSVETDTITILNQALEEEASASENKWKALLSDKVQNIKNFSGEALDQGLSLATGILESAF